LGERQITICRELTKRHEEADKTTLTQAMKRFGAEEPRGEFVIVIQGKSAEAMNQEMQKSWESISIEEHMKRYQDQGMDQKNAMKAVAKDRGIRKRDIYQYLLEKEKSS
jgi:16S rRNA (cytidine1402-2'-O)-methyltransferase